MNQEIANYINSSDKFRFVDLHHPGFTSVRLHQ